MLVSRSRSSLKLFLVDLILALTSSTQPPVFPDITNVAKLMHCLNMSAFENVLHWLLNWKGGELLPASPAGVVWNWL